MARIRLLPLSEQAVTLLARRAQRSADHLHAVTGGNPFFVNEVLASKSPGVPMSVRDAVLARATRLSPAARAVLEVVALVPARIDRWLLEAMLGPVSSPVARSSAGLLHQLPRREHWRPDAQGAGRI